MLTKRDDYNWASEAFDHEGPAYLDSITFNVLEEDSARQGALEAGQVDSVHFVQPSEEQRLIDDGFNVIYGEYLGTPINFVLRPNAEITNDVNVRQAIQHGVNRQEIVDTVFNSNWKPATSSVQAATPGWVDLSENLAFDQDLSSTLLDESGWTEKDAEGYRVKDGTRLTIPAYTSPFVNGSGQILELAAQQLKAVGIELEIRQTDASTYSDIFAAGGTPIFPVANSFLDATTLRQYWGQDYTNQFQLKNGELEEQLLGVSETANGTDERAANLAKLQETVLEEAYTVPIVDNYQVFVTSPEVHGIETNAVGRPYFYDTWIGQ
ncbi:ABC-type transport system substrate-binding protein [Pseudoclavibacter helvolus]|uniref:ABC-type transport system substrate-binding protein n=1 Tax=Pseudoclavibacter helvolus TaxID=255205 RepID=A0A7W4UQ61_9MICO|nr:ABC-type transport system substrate-binding protein [Pseudoclavibacter helvolus]